MAASHELPDLKLPGYGLVQSVQPPPGLEAFVEPGVPVGEVAYA